MLKWNRDCIDRLNRDTSVSIRTANLAKRYQSGPAALTIFENLNLTVETGERIALIGESGAGKSTLLHLLGGLDRPTEGQIFFGDQETTSLDDSGLADFRNRTIGYVWQTHHLLPEFTALENVMMPLLIRGATRTEAASPAMERLQEVGLKERVSHRAGELSGGEQQRVSLARALVGDPSVLLADEPTGNLDHRTGEKIADVLDDIHRRHRLTLVVVTHNLGFAKRCDRILKLDKGSITDLELLADLQHETPAQTTAREEDGTKHV